jgi:NAD(P)-dependent dehydrogenase (short-subunit alcohol dehydrogenase family)
VCGLGRQAKAIAFLAGNDASWITGEELVIDGRLLINHSANKPA